MAIEEVAWLADLRSGDAARQIRALHAASPCSGSSELYERYMPQLHELKKAPRPQVRKVALHLDQGALEASAVADERASGFRRNRAGGWGREGEPRRKAVRLGLTVGPPVREDAHRPRSDLGLRRSRGGRDGGPHLRMALPVP